MVKEKLTFTNPKKANTKKPQPKQQQIGQTKQPVAEEVIAEQVVANNTPQPVVAEVEDSNNELINKINKEIRQYRKQVVKHKKLHEDISNQLDFNVLTPTIPAHLNKKDLSFDEILQRKNYEAQIEESKKKEKQLKDMIEILENENKSLEVLETIQSSMSKIFNEYDSRQTKLEKDLKQLQKDVKQKDQQLEELNQTLNHTKFQLNLQVNNKKENVSKLTNFEQQINELTEQNKKLLKQNQDVESLKTEITRLQSLNSNLSKSLEDQKQQSSQQFMTQHNIIEEQKKLLQQKEETLMFNFSRFNQVNTELMMIKQQFADQDKFIKFQQHQLSLKSEENNSITKEVNSLKEENNSAMNKNRELLDNIKQLEEKIANLESSNKQLLEKMQKDENDHKHSINQLEEQLKQRPIVTFPVKFEEDIINEALDKKRTKDIVQLIQVLSFFNISNPDSFERRSMFLSDQFCISQTGKEVSILTHNDFSAIDALSRSLFGQQQNIDQVENCINDGVRKLEKIIARSEDDSIIGVSFKILAEQIRELASSSIYQYGKTLYPYLGQDENSLTSNSIFNTNGYNIRMDDSSQSSTSPKLKSNFINTQISTQSETKKSTIIENKTFEETPSNNINVTYEVPSEQRSWKLEVNNTNVDLQESTTPSAPIESEVINHSPANPNVVSNSSEDENHPVPSAPSLEQQSENGETLTKKKFTNYSRGRGRGGFAPNSRGGRQRKLFVRTDNTDNK